MSARIAKQAAVSDAQGHRTIQDEACGVGPEHSHPRRDRGGSDMQYDAARELCRWVAVDSYVDRLTAKELLRGQHGAPLRLALFDATAHGYADPLSKGAALPGASQSQTAAHCGRGQERRQQSLAG